MYNKETYPARFPPSNSSLLGGGSGIDCAAGGEVHESANLERLRGPQDVLQVGDIDVDLAPVHVVHDGPQLLPSDVSQDDDLVIRQGPMV